MDDHKWLFNQVVNEDAMVAIAQLCIKRKFRCKGCPYSIKKAVPEYEGLSCCIFDVCPCNWDCYGVEVSEEGEK